MTAADETTLDDLRAICAALSDSVETQTWGEPHFRVAGKIYCGFGVEKGVPTIGLKLGKEEALSRIAVDDRFRPAPYVGRHGWVSIDAARIGRAEVTELVLQSWRLIAPKSSLAKLGGG